MRRAAPEWAGGPVERYKFDRNLVEVPRYRAIEETFARRVDELVQDVQAGRLDGRAAAREFDRELRAAETEAFVAGRRGRRSTSTEITDAEARMLDGRHRHNMGYWRRFMRDVEAGRGRMDHRQRGRLYASSLWSLYTRGETADWDAPDAAGRRFYWIMDPDAEHCDECRRRARQSRDGGGFTYAQMVEMGWPGDGTTPCLVNCRCHVRAVTKRGVRPDDVPDPRPAATPEAGREAVERLLGGPGLPKPLPAAGIPMARVAPAALDASMAAAEGAGGAGAAARLGRLLPALPAATVYPQTVRTLGDDARIHSGFGLDVLIARSGEGVWEVAAVLAADEGLRRRIDPFAGEWWREWLGGER